ncbi:hypothetical protein [Verminephrobacter eiseniae]|uniref:hypothetical protein n=1 Tax=Verminephrobacter eiseniae TaxID=364317 RepID=UPI0022374C2A|nr:hypothetical protein [Verminephrobacter eiseniae]
MKHAEMFRYVADDEGDSVEPSDAQDMQDMLEQAAICVAAMRADFMPSNSSDNNHGMKP